MKILLISLLFQFYGVEGLKYGNNISGLNVLDSLYNPAVFTTGENWRLRVLTEFSYVSDYQRESKLVYDRYNTSIGEFTTYAGTYGYLKPSNFTISVAKKFINIEAGYELLRSYEYRYDNYLRSSQNNLIQHDYFISHGGLTSYFAGFGLKGRIFSLGLKLYRARRDIETRTNWELIGEGSGDIIARFFALYGNLDIFPRLRASFSYRQGVCFVFIRFMRESVLGPYIDVATELPRELYAGLSFTPPSRLVTEASFIYGKIGDYPWYRIGFRHNFLDIYPFEFAGGVYETEGKSWIPFFTVGAGVSRGKFRFSADVTYRNLKVSSGQYRHYYSEVTVGTKVIYIP